MVDASTKSSMGQKGGGGCYSSCCPAHATVTQHGGGCTMKPHFSSRRFNAHMPAVRSGRMDRGFWVLQEHKKLCAWPHYTSNLSRPGLPVHTRLTHGQLSGVRQREAAGSDKWMLIQFQPLMTWRDGLFKQLGDSGVLHWEHRGWRWREAGSSCLFSLADLFWKSNLHWWN